MKSLAITLGLVVCIKASSNICALEALLEPTFPSEISIIDKRPRRSVEPVFAIGVLVNLESGRKILAVGDSVAIQHDHVIDAIERHYGEEIVSYLWGGELKLRSNVWGMIRIVQADETSSYFKRVLGIVSDVGALKDALRGTGMWEVPLKTPLRWGDAPEHLHPGMLSRHDRVNTIDSIKEILIALLDEGEGTPGLERSNAAFAKLYKKNLKLLSDYLELLVNDQVIDQVESKIIMQLVRRFCDGNMTSHAEFSELLQEWNRIEGIMIVRQSFPQFSVRFVEIKSIERSATSQF